MPPIQMVGVIGEEPEAFLRALGGHLPDQVAPAGGVDAVERLPPGIPQAEAVMMTGDHRDIAHPCFAGEIRDDVGIEPLGGEVLRQFRICIERNLFVELHPLAFPEGSIKPIMDKEAEARLAEPPQRRRVRIMLPG